MNSIIEIIFALFFTPKKGRQPLHGMPTKTLDKKE